MQNLIFLVLITAAPIVYKLLYLMHTLVLEAQSLVKHTGSEESCGCVVEKTFFSSAPAETFRIPSGDAAASS